MTLSIQTNVASLDARQKQGRSQEALAVAVARLSSGLRINGAADDAAGLAIADRFTAQIKGLSQAGRNANDGISLVQTAEGGLAAIDANLQRIRELAVQAANATHSASDRASLQLEVRQLQGEVDRVATQTRFNGLNLLDGSFGARTFQVGADAKQTVTTPAIADARAAALGGYFGVNVVRQVFGGADNTLNPLAVQIGGGATVQLGQVSLDAKVQADAVNAGNVPGLRCTTTPTVVPDGASVAGATAGGTATLSINGVAIALAGTAGGAALAANRAVAVAAINAQSAATGVVATDTGSGLRLVAADARNVALGYSAGSFAGSSQADFGLPTTALWGGTLTIDYAAPPGVTGSVYFTRGAASSSDPIVFTGTALAAVDISTAAGAAGALDSLDAALATVGAIRASLGAVQNRFSSTTRNLRDAGDNLAASRSRIQDADFASETASLSRAQVLQQAGTAMIAQANQTSTRVLSLLKAG